jgi:chemotaxis protein methyltransferase CheR
MDAALLRSFAALARAEAGIHLLEGKEQLVAQRLAKRLRRLGLSDERAYLALLRGAGGAAELVHFLDAMATNFTCFFREREHFDALGAAAVRRAASGQRRLRFWSAAASSGEEPYTMAMVLEEALLGRDVDYRILATDLSTRALAEAVEGVYPEVRVARVPSQLRQRYFSRLDCRAGEGRRYAVGPALRERVAFARLNLATPPFPMRGPFDAVFCCNVMIYFDREVRQRLVAEIEHVLAPGGLLVLGRAETLNGIATALRPAGASTYQKLAPDGGRA